jgi:serine/threonine-protein kinase
MQNHEILERAPIDVGYAPGDLIAGKYRLSATVREGGMCRVRMGVHTMLDLPVAIKYLRPSFRCTMLARSLQREARATAALRHPAIVRIYDWGMVSADDAYIVMEQLDGDELRACLEREGLMPQEHAVRLLLPVCGAVAVAHARGIIHRDLKPENIVLSHDDAGQMQPKVLDFGIANRAFERRQGDGSGTVALGTLGYMPPEQAFALGTVDHRTDIWAFCAILYEALSGTLPVPGETLDELRRALVSEEIASLTEMLGVDKDLSAIVDRGLRREPHERWLSMRELGQELARWLLSRGVYDDIAGRSLVSEWLRPGSLTPPGPSVAVNDVCPTPLPFPLVRPKSEARPRRHARFSRARWELVRSLEAEAKKGSRQ